MRFFRLLPHFSRRFNWSETSNGPYATGLMRPSLVVRLLVSLRKLVNETLGSIASKCSYDGPLPFVHHGANECGWVLDDPEGDFNRACTGSDSLRTLISTSMDPPRKCLSPLSRKTEDLITCYRMGTSRRCNWLQRSGQWNLLDRLRVWKGKTCFQSLGFLFRFTSKVRKRALRIEPGKGLYAKIPALTEKDGIIDAAILDGLPLETKPRKSRR